MLYLILVRSSLAETQGRGRPARDKKKKWMSMCTHQCCMPHGIAGVSVPRETGEVKGVVPRPWLRSGTFVPTKRGFQPLRRRKRGLSGLRRLSAFSAISARHYHHQRDVVASRDVGVSPAIKPNPERGDYETLVVSRSVLSGSTKLMLKGPWASPVTA